MIPSKRSNLVQQQSRLDNGSRLTRVEQMRLRSATIQGETNSSATSLEPGSAAHQEDWLAVEEPLQIQISTEPFATIMRTPGADRELTLGLLFAEGVIFDSSEVSSLSHCGQAGDEGYGNTMEVTPAPGADLLGRVVPRAQQSSSACGVCGRQTIDDLLARVRPVRGSVVLTLEQAFLLIAELRKHQHNFTRTGGVHGAALASISQGIEVVFEDVGRHNAVDKVIGSCLRDGRVPLNDRILLVSSRASFEIVHKAVLAGVPIVICISAASTLAVETASRAGITLLGFARNNALNVYAGSQRLLRE